MVTEAKKASNRRWDAENMAYQTVKVSAAMLEEFRQAVKDRGDRVNTVLRQAMERYTAGEAPQGCNVTMPPETLQKARDAAEAAGEELGAWIVRAVNDTAERDRIARLLKR